LGIFIEIKMNSRTYRTKSGITQHMPSLSLIEEMIEDSQGFCLACGEIADGVEPDAERYECECCGKEKA
jgi:hypothetical protein